MTTSNNGLPVNIIEALAKLKLTGTQRRVIDVIWLNQPSPIRALDITLFTGIHEEHVMVDLRYLEKHKIIKRQFDDERRGRGIIPTTTVNTDVSEWDLLQERYTEKGREIGAPLVEKGREIGAPLVEKGREIGAPLVEKGREIGAPLPEKGREIGAPLLDINNSPKYSASQKEEPEKAKSPSEQAMELSNFLRSLIVRNNPKSKAPDITKWAIDIDRMISIDNRTPEEIRSVIEFCQNDDFWQSNILSTAKLREKFDQLYLKMKKGGSYGTNQRYSRPVPGQEPGGAFSDLE